MLACQAVWGERQPEYALVNAVTWISKLGCDRHMEPQVAPNRSPFYTQVSQIHPFFRLTQFCTHIYTELPTFHPCNNHNDLKYMPCTDDMHMYTVHGHLSFFPDMTLYISLYS